MTNRTPTAVSNVDSLSSIARAAVVAAVVAFVALNFAVSVEAQSDNDSPNTTPNRFTFVDVENVKRSKVIVSNTITVSGIDAPADISILGEGEYQINSSGTWESGPGKVTGSSSVNVRHTSSSEFNRAVNTVLNIGGLVDSFSSITEAKDTTPAQFKFDDKTDVAINTEIRSNEITVSGINSPAPISVTDGEYSLDGGETFTRSEGTVPIDAKVMVRHTSSTDFSTATNTTLDIGGVTDTFTSTTLGIDTTPNAFSFETQEGVARSTLIESNTIEVTGINADTSISTSAFGDSEGSDFEFKINDGDWMGANGETGSLKEGDKVTVRHTSASGFSTLRNQSVQIGVGESEGGTGFTTGYFTTLTIAGNTKPENFFFTDQTDVARSSVMISNTIKVSGIEVPADISVEGGEYSLDGINYTDSGKVGNGAEVRVRHTSSSEFDKAVNTTLTIGGVSDTFTSTTLVEKTTPDQFQFVEKTDVAINTEMISNTITVSGINSPAPISVTGGKYSLDGINYTDSGLGTVGNGAEVRVRHTSSSEFDKAVNTTLTIGGVDATFMSKTEAEQATPDAFSFTKKSDVARSTEMISNTITVSGINTAVAISVTGGGEYSINGGRYTAIAGNVEKDETVTVRHTSSGSFSTDTDTELNIGGVLDTFTSRTEAENTTPYPFAFNSQENVPRSTLRTSNEITVSGINSPAPISVTGGEYSLDGGETFTGPEGPEGTVPIDAKVMVRHTSSGNFSATTATKLTIGGVSNFFNSITLTESQEAADTTPKPFLFTDQTDVARSTLITSNAIIVSGLNLPAPISVEPGGKYSVNNGGYTADAGTVENGNTVTVSHTSSNNFNSPTNTTLTIGGFRDTFTSTTLVEKTTPDAFSFEEQTGTERDTYIFSNTIIVSGINSAATMSVSGVGSSSYSVNDTDFSKQTINVREGDRVQVRHSSSPLFSTTTNTTLTIGGVSETFTSTTLARKTTPDAFSFTKKSDVARSTEMISNTITVSGINSPAAISVSGGEYSFDGINFTSDSGAVGNGDEVTVRHTSSGSFSTATNTELTIGGGNATFTSVTVAAITTPDPFSLTDQTDVARSTLMTSNTITVSGIEAAATISVTGGEYSINGGGYTTNAGTVEKGSTVRVRHTSSGSFSTATDTELNIGGVLDTFTSTTVTEKAIPNAFSFTDQTDVARSTEIISNTITVSGINKAVAISVTGGEYSINGGGYTANAGTVENGNTVTVRHTSSGSFSAATNTELKIGGMPDTFTSITLPEEGTADTTPQPFSFIDQTDVARSTVMTSNTITVSGISAAAAITVTSGEYSVNGGGYTANAGTVENGDAVTVRHTSSDSFSTVTNTELDIGGVTDSFSSTTAGESTTPDAFSFTDQTDVARSTVITSNTITVSGINLAAAISVTGGEYSINSGGYTVNAGTVENGDTVTVRHTSSDSLSTATNTTLTIDRVNDIFSSTTLSAKDDEEAATPIPMTNPGLLGLTLLGLGAAGLRELRRRRNRRTTQLRQQ